MGTLTVYRSKSWVWAFLTVPVDVDGRLIGQIRRRDRLSVELPDGRHEISVRIGTTTIGPLSVELTSAGLIVAVRTLLPPDRTTARRADYWELAVVEGFTDQGIRLRDLYGSRPAVGYRRFGPRERVLFGLAFVALIGAQILERTVSPPIGVILGALASIVLVVLAFRLFLYRRDK